MKKQKVRVLTTGGTIEKSYDELEGTLYNKDSLISLLLSKVRLPHTEIEVQEIMAKDSLQMEDEDRKAILSAVKENLDTPTVILHGTDTMELTAQTCFYNLSELKHPVIFTGAMRPAGFEDSDARQNFIEALLASRLLEGGVYISFHGAIFPLPQVTKSKALRTFVATEQNS